MIDLQILGVGYTETTLAALAQAPLPDGWIYTVVDYLQPDGKVLVMAREAEDKNHRVAARADTLNDAITMLVERLSFELRWNRLMKETQEQAAETRRLAALGEELSQLGASLQAELARLRPYTEQTHASAALFAAASTVLEVAGKGSDEEVDLALVMLAEAVAWWDGLAGRLAPEAYAYPEILERYFPDAGKGEEASDARPS